MLSSSHSEHRSKFGLWVWIFAIAGFIASSGALAGDSKVESLLEARVETNTNRTLAASSEDESDATGYFANVGLLWTLRSERGVTLVRPRVRMQDYDDTSQAENVEAFLDMRSSYDWERGVFSMGLLASHEDLINAELSGARFNDVNPEEPTAPESGELQEGSTRNRFRASPTYAYRLSQRADVGTSLLYESASYDGSTSVTDYRYLEGSVFYRWDWTPSRSVSVGPYASNYDATDDSVSYRAYGMELIVAINPTELLTAELSLGIEQNDIEYGSSDGEDETQSVVNATVVVQRNWETSRIRLVAGQFATPSSRGNKTLNREVRAQYDIDLSSRLLLQTAGRYFQEEAIGEELDQEDRSYARAEFGALYRVTRSWYVSGGYRYTWQERDADPSDAKNNTFYLSVGYDGRQVSR